LNYEYKLKFALTKELLNRYKKGSIGWEKKILEKLDIKNFNNSVLFWRGPTAQNCHRRLTTEYLQNSFENSNIQSQRVL
jgi:hypothetical protein